MASVQVRDAVGLIANGYVAGGDGSTTNPLILAHATPQTWQIPHAPAVNTVATITKAAGAAGVKHVATAVSFTFAAGTAAPAAVQLTVNLRDGASGAGTILMSWTVCIPATAGITNSISLSGLNVIGTAATAMTLEFTAAGGANTFESVNLVGYDTV